MRRRIALLSGLAGGLLLPVLASAQTVTFDLGEGGELTGRIVQLLLLMTVLSLAPSILVMVTSFTRIVVVLSLLRSALGVQQTPPNTVIISLALFLTAFVMAPTLEQAWQQGIVPLINEEIDETEAFERTMVPMRAFMIRHVREKDLALFIELSGTERPAEATETPLHVMVPVERLAFVPSDGAHVAETRQWTRTLPRPAGQASDHALCKGTKGGVA